MKEKCYTKQFVGEPSSLKSLKNFIIQIGRNHKIPQSTVLHIRLALEELVVNIISYGRVRQAIELTICCYENHCVFDLISDGVSFNPLKFKEAHQVGRLESQPSGGLGILLAKTFMDNVSYQYKNGRNCVTLVKEIHLTD